jgi:ribosome-associated protein
MTHNFTTQLNGSMALSNAAATSPQETFEDHSLALALAIAQAADERKGADIVLLKVTDVSYLADYFVVITGFSSVQVRAIARSIQDKVEVEWQRQPQQIEGMTDGSWVLLDYGDVIVHVFLPGDRDYYNLEAFWGHAEQIKFSASES